MVATLWFAISGPANLPKAITGEKVNAEINRGRAVAGCRGAVAAGRPDCRGPMSVDQLKQHIEAETARWKPVLEQLGQIGK